MLKTVLARGKLVVEGDNGGRLSRIGIRLFSGELIRGFESESNSHDKIVSRDRLTGRLYVMVTIVGLYVSSRYSPDS
jgi:hypothetical protein